MLTFHERPQHLIFRLMALSVCFTRTNSAKYAYRFKSNPGLFGMFWWVQIGHLLIDGVFLPGRTPRETLNRWRLNTGWRLQQLKMILDPRSYIVEFSMFCCDVGRYSTEYQYSSGWMAFLATTDRMLGEMNYWGDGPAYISNIRVGRLSVDDHWREY